MQLTPDLLSTTMLWLAWALTLPVVAFALAASGLGRLAEDRVGLHLLAGSVVALIMLWTLRAHVGEGPGLHVLGVTTVTLLLGPARAVLATLAAEIVVGFLAGTPTAIAASWLVVGLVPLLVTESIRRRGWRRFPRVPFVFQFGCAFFGSAVALTASDGRGQSSQDGCPAGCVGAIHQG